MSFSVEVLAGIAIELQRGIGHQDRFQRLITTLRQVLATPRRCCVMNHDNLFHWRLMAWRRTSSADVLPWKGIRAWKPSPARGTWCVFRPIAIYPIRMTG